MIVLGLGHALQSGALVRVDLVLGKLGPGLRRWVEVALCLVTLALMGFLMRFFWISVQRAYERGTISMTRAATPIWIPEGIMLAGMAIFTFALAVYCLRLVLGGPLIRDSGHIE
jgi:TRAP-type C4-dicarboxylate transport system permease small subunit